MGFNYFNKGNIHKCYVKDKNVVEVLESGLEVKYETSLDIDIEVQQNIFYGPNVFFWLIKDGLDYIGIDTGVVLIFKEDLLLTWRTWKQPIFPLYVLAGYKGSDIGIDGVLLDTRDHQTLYMETLREECLAPRKLYGPFETVTAMSNCAFMHRHDLTFIIEKGGGVDVNHYEWTFQDSLRSSNCRVII